MNLFRTSAETACTVRVDYLLNLQAADPMDPSLHCIWPRVVTDMVLSVLYK